MARRVGLYTGLVNKLYMVQYSHKEAKTLQTDDFSFVPGITRDGVTVPSVANAAGEKHANAIKYVRNLFILCLIISQVHATEKAKVKIRKRRK